MGFAVADLHELFASGIKAADMSLKLVVKARWQVHDHVQVFAPFPFVVLAGPDPIRSDSPAGAPGGDAGSHILEELIQLPCRIGVEVNGVKVECGPQRVPDYGGKPISPAEIPTLLGRDALRVCLATTISLRLGATSAPVSSRKTPLPDGHPNNRNTYQSMYEALGWRWGVMRLRYWSSLVFSGFRMVRK
jgi:hypothetical protein